MATVSVKAKNYNGITQKTVKNFVLGAGALFKNFEVGTDTYATAKSAGKLIGATRDGSTFRVEVTIEQIPVDGAIGRVKGLQRVTRIDVHLETRLVEYTSENLAMALQFADVTEGNGQNDVPESYDLIEGRMSIEDEDFKNLTLIACKSGSDVPMCIQLFNGLNENGLEIATDDSSTSGLPLSVYGYNDIDDFIDDNIKPPYAIYNPKIPA